jgi:TRAP-type C4-dicarboxylate transport system permease small subunit
MHIVVAGAILCLILWLVLAFALAIPSGWVHLPLAIGCILIARAIVGKR